jgi:hypothetical protein
VANTPRRTLAVILLAFVLAVGGTFLFATRVRRQLRLIQAEHEPIRSWMSIPFVAHAHHVLPSVLYQALGVTPQQPRDRRPIGRIARDLKRPVADVEAQLQHAIDASANNPGGPAK